MQPPPKSTTNINFAFLSKGITTRPMAPSLHHCLLVDDELWVREGRKPISSIAAATTTSYDDYYAVLGSNIILLVVSVVQLHHFGAKKGGRQLMRFPIAVD